VKRNASIHRHDSAMGARAYDEFAGLRAHLARRYPALHVLAIEPLAPDAGATTDTASKAAGYGRPVRIRLGGRAGTTLELVWHVATANPFGHDRRSDRAAETLLAYDDFAAIPQHVRALEVGAVDRDGHLVSLPAECELYMLTEYAQGAIYADELRRIARDGVATEQNVAHVDVLARYLAALHEPLTRPHAYRRAIRDLVGHGEGIFGIIDGYPDDTPAASPERLHAIEERCASWRWRLRGRADRLVRTHGDFHPFNILFDGDELRLLDASRGTCGDAADDLTALAVNYVLFALEHPASWARGLGVLWHRLWQTYFAARPDADLLAVAPPYFAWRALVVCNPCFYPALAAPARDALLGLATRWLDAGCLDLASPEELMR
jgi:hypothetical protein